jgi:hypothetical protein
MEEPKRQPGGGFLTPSPTAHFKEEEEDDGSILPSENSYSDPNLALVMAELLVHGEGKESESLASIMASIRDELRELKGLAKKFVAAARASPGGADGAAVTRHQTTSVSRPV